MPDELGTAWEWLDVEEWAEREGAWWEMQLAGRKRKIWEWQDQWRAELFQNDPVDPQDFLNRRTEFVNRHVRMCQSTLLDEADIDFCLSACPTPTPEVDEEDDNELENGGLGRRGSGAAAPPEEGTTN